MLKRLRLAASVLLVAGALVAVASPAVATPRAEPPARLCSAPASVASELLAWLGQWFGGMSLEGVWAANGHAIDPDGQPSAPSSSDPSDGDATAQNGHAIDPDG